jgi:hypothetical protein
MRLRQRMFLRVVVWAGFCGVRLIFPIFESSAGLCGSEWNELARLAELLDIFPLPHFTNRILWALSRTQENAVWARY